jgi:3-oxoacyl-[acyl-carrier protein] reductase
MKTVLVTGVSRGLGLAIAGRLAHDGYRVVGLGRTLSKEYQALIHDNAGNVFFEQFDVADVGQIATRSREVLAAHRPIYALVNNAGIGLDGVLATQHHTDIQRLIDTNLTGPITLTKYVSRSMLSRGEGRIVNISSIIASTGFHGLAVYAASKAGLEGFTRSLSRELGKANITVNCVAPGYMETEMTRGLAGEKITSVRRRAPLGLPTVEDATGAVSYLLGPDGGRLTGTVITVDGGSTA